jgi:hypothetical protein
MSHAKFYGLTDGRIFVLIRTQICIYWDYTPSREITAMFYPLFEYSFLAYIILDNFNMKVSYSKGQVPQWMYRLSSILLPIKVVLVAWFRMIFVNLVSVNMLAHAFGFLGLQICLCLVGLENVLYLNATQVSYRWLGGRRNTKIASWAYLAIASVTAAFKMFFTTYHILAQEAFWGVTPGLTKNIDRFWMLLFAVMPLWFAHLHIKTDPALQFTIDFTSETTDDITKTEATNLI